MSNDSLFKDRGRDLSLCVNFYGGKPPIKSMLYHSNDLDSAINFMDRLLDLLIKDGNSEWELLLYAHCDSNHRLDVSQNSWQKFYPNSELLDEKTWLDEI
jgi:hypothetical protein